MLHFLNMKARYAHSVEIVLFYFYTFAQPNITAMRKFLGVMLCMVPVLAQAQVSIVYENDAHSTVKGYPAVATVKSQQLAENKNVLVVSGGDFSTDFMPAQTLGKVSQGAGIIKIMNRIGYDYVVPGNHDFDFSMEVLRQNMSDLKAKTLCCNLKDLASGQLVFADCEIRKCGKTKIAFIGVATPKTISRQLHSVFYDSDEKPLYSFCEENLCDVVQQSIDKARKEGADYVIVLSHLGDKDNGSLTSVKLIEGTSGIDVVLDAHAHTVISDRRVADKSGHEVILTSTGLKFANVGLLRIEKDGTISTKLIPVADIEPDQEIADYITQVSAEYGL